MGSQVRILSIRLAWEYRFPWTRPERADQAVWPALPASGINTSVTTGKKGRRALEDEGIQTFSLGVIPRASTRKPAILFRPADNTSPPCDVSEKNTAMRMWCSGSMPASQAGDRGFEPRHPLYPEKNQNNGSNPIMGLVTVFPWDVSGETWTNSLGMGAHRLGRKHASRPGSSEEEQVPFKHWVRIS